MEHNFEKFSPPRLSAQRTSISEIAHQMPILTEPDVENADENNDNYDEIA
jgi:hypothetical protein